MITCKRKIFQTFQRIFEVRMLKLLCDKMHQKILSIDKLSVIYSPKRDAPHFDAILLKQTEVNLVL